MAALATVEDLQTRMMVTFDATETAAATAALDDISALVRLYGKPAWGDTVPVPDVVKAVVLAVAERRMRNPEGYVSEIAGEYQYRLPEATGSALRADELATVRLAAGRTGLVAVPVQRPYYVGTDCDRYYPFGKDPRLGDL